MNDVSCEKGSCVACEFSFFLSSVASVLCIGLVVFLTLQLHLQTPASADGLCLTLDSARRVEKTAGRRREASPV